MGPFEKIAPGEHEAAPILARQPAARGIWSHRVAVQFGEPLDDFEPEIKELGERQRKLGLRP